MAFSQFKLERTTAQTRGIFDKYAYSTPDTIADILTIGYFANSRFKKLALRSLLFADCSDGFAICLVTLGTLELLYNSNVPYTAPVSIVESSEDWDEANLIYLDTDGGDVEIQLPPAANYPDEEIYFKRITNSTNIANLIPFAGDTFEGESVFDEFPLAFKNDLVKIKSDGVNTWRILERRTFCGASLTLIPPGAVDVTTTPTKLEAYNSVMGTTRLRCEGNLANSSIDILSTQIDPGDFYDIRFSASLQYQVNQNVHLQVYCDGTPLPTLSASTSGEGPSDNCNLSLSQMVHITAPCVLTLMIWGDVINAAVISGLMFDAKRIGG